MLKQCIAKWHWYIAVGLFFIALSIYTFKLGEISSGFHGDEAELALFSSKIIRGEVKSFIGVGVHNHPIISLLPQALSFSIFGENIFSARLPSAIFSAASIPIFYFFLLHLFNARVALFSSILFLASHLWIAMSRFGPINTQVVFFELLVFYFLFLALKTKRIVFFVLLALGCSMMFYLYVGFRVIPIIVVIILLKEIIFREEKRRIIRAVLISSIFFLFASLPQINFFLHHPNAFNDRTNSIFIFGNSAEAKEWREYNDKGKTYGEILLEQTKKTFMLSSPRDTSGQYGYPNLVLDPITTLFVSIGILITITNILKTKYLLLLLWFFLTLLMGNILMINPFFLPRATVAIPAVYIFAGLALNKLFYYIKRFPHKTTWVLYFITYCFIAGIIVSNIKIYFIDSEKEMFGDTAKYTATKIANYIKMHEPIYTIVFLTSPGLHAHFAPIRFLAPNANIVNIDNPKEYLPKTVSKTIFIVYPYYKNKLEELMAINPHGILTTEHDKKERIQYFIYKIN